MAEVLPNGTHREILVLSIPLGIPVLWHHDMTQLALEFQAIPLSYILPDQRIPVVIVLPKR